MTQPLRRLIDLPGIAELETRALMKPSLAEPEARAEVPEIDEICRASFGLAPDEAEAVALPADWDGIDAKPLAQQVFAFEDAGWDVTDKRRPLRMLGHYALPLWLAIRGVAGQLPFEAPPAEKSDDWAVGMAADAKAYRKR
ncbi:MAG: hypothetical protein Q7U20_02635 [Caulobacter sp.]|nr:hypothetical protein [Caulobacter sp.]